MLRLCLCLYLLLVSSCFFLSFCAFFFLLVLLLQSGAKVSTIPRQVSCCCCDSGWGCGSACLVSLSRQQGKCLKKGGWEARREGAAPPPAMRLTVLINVVPVCCPCSSCICLLLFFQFFLFLGTSEEKRAGDTSSNGRRKKFGALHCGNVFLGSYKWHRHVGGAGEVFMSWFLTAELSPPSFRLPHFQKSPTSYQANNGADEQHGTVQNVKDVRYQCYVVSRL